MENVFFFTEKVRSFVYNRRNPFFYFAELAMCSLNLNSFSRVQRLRLAVSFIIPV